MAIESSPVGRWTIDDVCSWLRENDFDDYVELFSMHKIDGAVLLQLTETDLREPPMKITVLGDIKRIGIALEILRRDNGESNPLLSVKPMSAPGVLADESQTNGLPHFNHVLEATASAPAAIPRRPSNSVFLISRIESPDTELKSLSKTLVALMYCCVSLLCTAFVMVIVHDRVPDMKTYPPLPDIFLDNVPLIPWAFEVCELLACVLGCFLLLVVIFHKHRLILLRRFFSLTGTVFCLRCVTMLITSLSVPGVHLECRNQSFEDMYAKVRQALRIWYGMGMSLRGVRTCGDYMFSGHTTAVTLLNHFITEYTPDDWHNIHTASWVMNLFSIFFILAGHEHYSIDVFIAFYISSRLFLYYHSMAYHANSLASTDSRTRSWFPLFWFFESGGQLGRVPNEFSIPFSEQVSRWWNSRPQNSHKGNQGNTAEDTQGKEEQRRNKVRFEVGPPATPQNGHHKSLPNEMCLQRNYNPDKRIGNKKKTKSS